MNTKQIKATLTAQYPVTDYKTTVKLVEEHEVGWEIYPYKRTVPTFVAVGVETRRADLRTPSGKMVKVHPDGAEVLAILRNAGFNARHHTQAMTQQMIAVE